MKDQKKAKKGKKLQKWLKNDPKQLKVKNDQDF